MKTPEDINRLLEEKIITKEQFSDRVEKMYVMQQGNISFMEIVIYTAEFYQIDINDIAKYLTKRINDRIESEAIAEHMLISPRNKSNTLNSFFAAA